MQIVKKTMSTKILCSLIYIVFYAVPGYYVYTEASDVPSGSFFFMFTTMSPGLQCFRFYYYMKGKDGALALAYIVGGKQTVAWVTRGDHGDKWHMQQIHINPMQQIYVSD